MKLAAILAVPLWFKATDFIRDLYGVWGLGYGISEWEGSGYSGSGRKYDLCRVHSSSKYIWFLQQGCRLWFGQVSPRRGALYRPF